MSQEVMIIDDFMTAEECQVAIDATERIINGGMAAEFGTLSNPSLTDRKDIQVYANSDAYLLDCKAYNTRWWETFRDRYHQYAIPAYLDRFDILKKWQLHTLEVKLQKTRPTGGFHKWHYEASDTLLSERKITFSLFLNDDFEAGETEFLYYQKRVEAKTGRLALFPSHWGATHRGNPPIGGDKYIATGWTVNVDPYQDYRIKD